MCSHVSRHACMRWIVSLSCPQAYVHERARDRARARARARAQARARARAHTHTLADADADANKHEREHEAHRSEKTVCDRELRAFMSVLAAALLAQAMSMRASRSARDATSFSQTSVTTWRPPAAATIL